jgi:S-(hydroxymethyl)glutathione dehydrogenase/alcohol dehydrogenase
MNTFRAAALTRHNAPLELVDLSHVITDHSGNVCSYGQVKIRMIQSGICGAQLGEQAGHKNPETPLPRLMGHEGVGIIKEVGPGVNVQMKGKKCVLHWRKGDGPEATLPARYNHGLSSIGGGHIVTLAESVVVSANRVTVVPDATPDDLCALLGCGLSTALGTIEQEAKMKLGESVLILGCGGVGANLILAACAAGAGKVTVVDKDPGKSNLAMDCGANSFLGLGGIKDRRYDVIVDTTGVVEVLEAAIPLLSGTGRLVMLGQTKPGESFRVNSAVDRFYGEGVNLKWSQGGGFNPSRDIPRYLALWDAGRINLDGVVTHRFGLEDVNKGMDLVRAGQAGRIMITM